MSPMKTIIVLFVAMIALTSAKKLTLVSNGSESLALTYLIPKADEELRIQLEMTRSGDLTRDQNAAAVCFTLPDENYTLAVGESRDAFGIAFLCTRDVCSSSTHLNAAFFGSTVTKTSTDTIVWNGSGDDLSSNNVGSLEPGSGTHAKTRYGLDEAAVERSHVPQVNTTEYIQCHAVITNQGNLQFNEQITVSGWALMEQKEFTVTEDEFTEEKLSSGASFQQMSVMMIAAVILAFFLY